MIDPEREFVKSLEQMRLIVKCNTCSLKSYVKIVNNGGQRTEQRCHVKRSSQVSRCAFQEKIYKNLFRAVRVRMNVFNR